MMLKQEPPPVRQQGGLTSRAIKYLREKISITPVPNGISTSVIPFVVDLCYSFPSFTLLTIQRQKDAKFKLKPARSTVSNHLRKLPPKFTTRFSLNSFSESTSMYSSSSNFIHILYFPASYGVTIRYFVTQYVEHTQRHTHRVYTEHTQRSTHEYSFWIFYPRGLTQHEWPPPEQHTTT